MQKEAQIEEKLIQHLVDLKYNYRPDIRDRQSLEQNFRKKFEALNTVTLTDSEFARLLDDIITPDVFIASKKLRETNTFSRDDGTPLHYTLVNIKDWCKNDFEVVNQLRINTHSSFHRYDVLLLINGVPVVQIELKALEVTPRRAMQQIVDYKNDTGNGYANTLLCFMQLFIVSNQTNTYYFTNNKNQHFNFNADEKFLPVYQFADEKNKKITHLDDFADSFLAKCKLGEMINRYMVLVATEQKLLVMRPYQIYAVKAIVDCIHQNRGNGYIWHTTGSGKTLTSFKTSTLLKDHPDIEKCLFVVDRKDLDKQTRDEFNNFQKGCVEENTNTEKLVERMLSTNYSNKIIVTTIQKLGLALDPNNRNNYKEKLQPLSKKRVVLIFDECHRSQFGENHKAIKEFFPHAQLFGFTGTPIFEENATWQTIEGGYQSFFTTDDVFQKQLHAYTITNAIDDQNVLRFHIDYFKGTAQNVEETVAKQAVVETILEKHQAATNARRFNAVLATASINDAIEYYHLFKDIQEKRKTANETYEPLNIACVFSPPAYGNKDVQQIQEDLPQEKADNEHEPEEKKKALETIIADYNRRFNTNHSIYDFDLYYQDVQKRIKDQQYSNADLPQKNKIDITIVVDMLLTGFDSKYLNTLYVDKNLKHHGLIQAFSRTNRTLNHSKPYGNILDFRKQEKQVEEAIRLFSGENAERAKEIWMVDPIPVVIDKYKKAIANLQQFMQRQGLECLPQEVHNIKGDEARAEFINCFKEVQRLNIQLDQYTDKTEENKTTIETLLQKDDYLAFKGAYLETAKRLKEQQDKPGADGNLQQLDFEFVLFASAVVDYDYIMKLVAKNSQAPEKQKMSPEQIISLLSSTSNMMDERDDMTEYIYSLPPNKPLMEQEIKEGFQEFKEEKIRKQMINIAKKHELEISELKNFTDFVLHRMIFDTDKLDDLFAHLDLGWKMRVERRDALMKDYKPFLEKLAGGREISGLKVWE